MKNLKRALSFALASVMVIGMMVVGAGAADFTDADSIVNKEAVDTMVALNVLSGKEDGSFFAPGDTLTRAEAAKIAVYILHGGKAPTIGTKTNPSFTDIKGNWAEAYIEYCTSTGIIAGKGDGTFGPNDKLTGSAFAKILLVAMGYDATVYNLIGNDWEINTNVEANKIKLYEDIETIDPTVAISRDNAAQMAYNALFAGIMEESYSLNTQTGAITNGYYFYADKNGSDYNLFTEKFGGEKKYGYITSISYDDVKKEYTYTLTNNGTAWGGTNIAQNTDEDGVVITTIKSAVDYSALFGAKVAIVYKDADTDVLYGFYPEAETVIEGTLGEVGTITGTSNKLKYAGVEYTLGDVANNVEVIAFNDTYITNIGALPGTTNFWYKADKFVAYDDNGDGKADMVVWFPVDVDEATYVGTKSITAGGVSYTLNKDTGLYEVGSVEYKFPTVAKGDYIVVERSIINNNSLISGEVVEVAVAETLTGKVVGVDATNEKVMINDTWYEYELAATPVLNTTYKFQVVNGYLMFADEVDSASKDLFMVIGSVASNTIDKVRADVLFADGTREVISIKKANGSTASSALTLGQLYTYTANSDGTYDVKVLSSTNKAGFNAYDAEGSTSALYVAATTSVAAKFNGYLIADDAVFFLKSVVNGTTKYSIMTGAELKKYDDESANAYITGSIYSEILTDKANGLDVVKVASFSVGDTFDVSDVYAYITSTPYTTKEGSITYYNYTAWTKNGVETVKDNPTSGTPAKGGIVVLKTQSDGSVSSSALAGSDAANATVIVPVAITGFNAADRNITMNLANGTILKEAAHKYGDKVQFMYVDTENYTGLEGGEVALAEKLDSGKYVLNAYAIYTCDGSGAYDALKAIVFDVTNDLYSVGDTTATIAVTSAVTNATQAEATTGVTHAAEGDQITITVKMNGGAYTADGKDTFTVGSTTYTIPADTYADGDTVASFKHTVTSGELNNTLTVVWNDIA